MPHKLNLKTIEKVGKAIVLSYIILALAFFTIVLLSEISGKNVSFGVNYPFPGNFLGLMVNIGLLVNIGVLMLIFVSVIELIRAYRKAANK